MADEAESVALRGCGRGRGQGQGLNSSLIAKPTLEFVSAQRRRRVASISDSE